MPRILSLAMLLAVVIGLAEGANAEPFFLAYLTPAGSTPVCDLSATDPVNFQGGDSMALPDLPPTIVAVGLTLQFDLCFIVWPVVDPAGSETVCLNATGTPSCAEQVKFTTNGGISVVGFTPTPAEDPPPLEFPNYRFQMTSTSLFIAGGHPVSGRQGSNLLGLPLGMVTLQGVSSAGHFQLTSEGGYVSAGMQRMPIANMVLAVTEDNCGDNVLDAGEQCDDGNADFGDGCAPTCKTEERFALIGSVGTQGILTVEIDNTPVTLDLSSLQGESAEGVVEVLVANVNDANLGATAAQVDDPGQAPADDGRAFVTDGVFTAVPSLTGSDGAIAVPEPGQLALLLAGLTFLVAIGRRRIQPR